jgi:predicted Ser/Thr protein kinase
VISETILQYRIIKKLAAGGMGEVYLAEDTKLRRRVAIKILPADLTENEDRRCRFEREAQAASALNHPNIVTIHEIGESEVGRFVVMELVEGVTLREVVSETCAPERAIHIARQAAEALRVAHEQGIVHRDIKPENIMVRADGDVKLLDFGLARLIPQKGPQSLAETAMLADHQPVSRTSPGMLLGTPRYMSPEQARGETLSEATDIFSLGLVVYELVTGQHPFQSDSQIGVRHAIVSRPALSPSRLKPEIPAELETLILRMLEKDPSRRPNATETEECLAKLLREGTGMQRGPLVPSMELHSVGREKERAEMLAGFESAAAGRGLMLCISGEPGMGKTTLVEDFLSVLTAHRAPHSVARGRCSERLAGTEAYLPLLEALDSLIHAEGGESAAHLMKLVAPTWYAQIAPLDGASAIADVKGTSQERMKLEISAFLEETSRPGHWFYSLMISTGPMSLLWICSLILRPNSAG